MTYDDLSVGQKAWATRREHRAWQEGYAHGEETGVRKIVVGSSAETVKVAALFNQTPLELRSELADSIMRLIRCHLRTASAAEPVGHAIARQHAEKKRGSPREQLAQVIPLFGRRTSPC